MRIGFTHPVHAVSGAAVRAVSFGIAAPEDALNVKESQAMMLVACARRNSGRSAAARRFLR